jgi:PAS domain S-box-containing protein
LSADENLLETIFNNMFEAVLVLDEASGRLVYANRVMCSLFGYASSDVPHLTILDLDGEEAGQPAARIRERLSLACRGAPQVFVWKARKKDGATFDAEISLQKAAIGEHGRIIALVRDVTKYIQAEEEASFFRALTEHTQEPLYALDLGDGGRTVYANPAACRHFGLDLETLQTLRIPDWDPKFNRETAEAIEARIEKEGVARIESEHRIASGAIVPVEITCSKRIEYKGKTLGLGCFHDISERKRIEAQLQRGREELEKRVEDRTAELAETIRALGNARDFLDKIINAITDPIYVMDREHKLVLVNDTLCAFFGRSRQELMSGICDDLLAGVQMDAGLKKTETIFAADREHISEVETADPQGGKHIFLAKKIPYKDLNGNKFIVGIARDITEQKQAEEALRLSQFCIDRAGIGIYQSDENGTIFNVNEHACNSLGYSKEELRALSVFDIDPEITPERMLALRQKIDETGLVTHHTTHRRRDGFTFPVEITANALDFRGKRYGISFVKDITERRRAEERLRESESRVRRKLESILDPEGDIGELELADILDAPQIQALMDDLYQNADVKTSIIDLKGRVLVDVGWQKICRKFHRGHPETLRRCIESDTVMSEGIPAGEFRTYRCRNNMWHLVTPIVIGGKHMGNLFMGQFFFENEALSYDLFRSQARAFGFPEEEYIAALEAVPRHSEDFVNKAKAFALRLIDMFSTLSYENIKLARLLSERDRLTEKLRAANKVVENSPVVLFRWKGNDTWPVELVSGNVIQFGYEPEAFLSGALTYSEIIYPEDLERVTREVHDIRDGGGDLLRLEYRIMTKGGQVRWVNELTNVERDEAGSIQNFEGVVIDVTERKRAEEAIRYSRAKYQAIVDNFDGYIYICSKDYRIEFMNKKLIERTGYDATGELCYRMMHDRDAACPWCVNERISKGETLHWEMFSPKDHRWFYVVNVPIPHSDGTISKQSMMLDITDRKQAEEELKHQKQLLEDLNSTLEERVREIRRLNETLEERVAERTAELENRARQLRQMALELTDAEDRERRRIASILHDDFQQELAYIKLELGILQNKTDRKEIQQRLAFLERIIGESIEKSRNLSYEMNPPALIQSGLIVALKELAQNMKTRFGLNVTVHIWHHVASHSVVLASILFRSVRELLFNVIKHAGVDSARIDVGSKNGLIHVQIKDLGNGFIYDPGRPRLEGETSGFGIWNIEDRITFLGGRMKIKTAPGKGCCVELIVPKDVLRKNSMIEPAGDEKPRQEWVNIEPIQRPLSFDEGSQIRILLADDHQMMREALAKLLKDCKGMMVVGQANDGSEAVRLAAQLKPHVLLMDVTMPVLDGFEAAAQVKRDNPDIRIIGLSVHNDAHTRQKMLHVGASAFLTKSALPVTLVETIRNVYSGNIIE